MSRKKRKNRITPLFICLMLIVLLCCGLFFFGQPVRINHLFLWNYPVRGVDVSSYQGEIDWAVLADQGISFAFIKATEGSSLVDNQFTRNWESASLTGLRVGAYHFFSFDSSGATQAANYISTVPVTEGMLPPVIDLEYYGEHIENPPTREQAQAILDELLQILAEHYGMHPVIYVNTTAYDRYLSGSYENNDIWIRNVYYPPRLSDGRTWTFWQYSSHGRLDGYEGPEHYIDLNVFYGSERDFENYAMS